jgi:transcriptional regulator with XRE-family HTH domain
MKRQAEGFTNMKHDADSLVDDVCLASGLMTAFGERLDALRKARKLTLRAMGRQISMSHGNLSKVLNGSHEAPSPPLGADLQLWFDVVGTDEADEERLRLLAAAAHVPLDSAREELERFILRHTVDLRDVTRAADGTGTRVPTTRQGSRP